MHLKQLLALSEICNALSAPTSSNLKVAFRLLMRAKNARPMRVALTSLPKMRRARR